MGPSLVAFVVSIAVAGLLIALLLRSSRAQRPDTVALEAALAAHRRRILSPQFPQLAAHFARPLPASYTEFFGRPAGIPSSPFYLVRAGTKDSLYVGAFFPADPQSLKEASWTLTDPSSQLPIADSDGDVFYVPLAEASAEDGPVYLSHHDGNDQELLCSSLRTFLTWQREPAA